MEPCPFIRLTVGNLALSLPLPTKPPRNAVHPTTSPQPPPPPPPPPPCFCKIKLNGFPTETALIPYSESNTNSVAAVFHLSVDELSRLLKKRGNRVLKIVVYAGRRGGRCGVGGGRVVGKVVVSLEGLLGVDYSRMIILNNGWNCIGKDKQQFHICVRADPDPRFVFQFDAQPECSPLVFQTNGNVNGNVRQPVFTCNFSFRNTCVGDYHQRNSSSRRSLQSEQGSGRGWLSSFGSERERAGKERKGWSVTVHDLSGSPVAAASMVTPFVASPGSDRVSRSNPGSWLILRPGEGTWKPWGRLEAWRGCGTADGVGYKFELIPDMISASSGVVLAESTISTSKGGKFVIDLASPNINISSCGGGGGGSSKTGQRSNSGTGCSPRVVAGSGDFGYGLWPYSAYRGFVMSAKVEGEGKCSKPTVEVSVQHVSCTEDAAGFVALAAAIDLSISACKLFSQKLRKELCQNNDLGC